MFTDSIETVPSQKEGITCYYYLYIIVFIYTLQNAEHVYD